ncbi:MAG: radical SAM protein [Candidatus Korarchaeum sp.]|nr:radical SAM protein [Candidatus Korarchaeum sp.]
MVVELAKRSFEVAGREINIGGPRPQVRESEKLVRYTSSICPECYRILPAILVERDGAIFIRKVCPEHGEYEDLYWGDSELFRKAMRFEVKGRGIYPPHTSLKTPCPFSCGICEAHWNTTALANLVVTNRCNMDCWYCFFYAEKMGYVYEPSLEEIDRMIDLMLKEKPAHGNAVQITGGEPLLRDDIVEIVRLLKRKGVTHIQLNTEGIAFLEKPWLMKELREAGVNTIYFSFDGVTPIANPKTHWETPYILDLARKSSMTSIVLVPTVIKGINDREVGDIVKFAAYNIDVVRGVNFQPVSLTGRMPRDQRDKYRITIPDVIKRIEEQTDGQISRESWYPVPFTVPISQFVEAITGKPKLMLTNHPACGMATYVFPVFENVDGRREVKFIPITDFVDVEGLYEFLSEKTREIMEGRNKLLVLLKVVSKLSSFIEREKQPPGLDLIKILRRILLKRNYEALGEFHYKALFLGMMHFMDLYNYDIQRVIRCDIHYFSPDGRMIPFCTYNVISDIYRDRVLREHSMSLEEYERKYGSGKVGPSIKYKRDIKKLESSELYLKTYEPFMDKIKGLRGDAE